jgi:hypothetical protein
MANRSKVPTRSTNRERLAARFDPCQEVFPGSRSPLTSVMHKTRITCQPKFRRLLLICRVAEEKPC